MPSKTRVNTVQCRLCPDEIYSRARHDFRYCTCGNTTVDGGAHYLKFSWSAGDKPEIRLRYVKATARELYDDWNQRTDKFGLIVKGKR